MQISNVALTAWKGTPGKMQSEWSLQSVWNALKVFENQGQQGIASINLETDKTLEQPEALKKTRNLSHNFEYFGVFVMFL